MKEEFGINVTPIGFFGQHYHEYVDFSINLNLIKVQADIEELYERRSQWTSHDEVLWFSEIQGIKAVKQIRKWLLKFSTSSIPSRSFTI